jgi:hypothetical protein
MVERTEDTIRSGRTGVLVAVAVGVREGVCVTLGEGVYVLVGVRVAVADGVPVMVGVRVAVADSVVDAVRVRVAVTVAVGVASGCSRQALPSHPHVSEKYTHPLPAPPKTMVRWRAAS